ncbi:DUF4870 domain-containing protein [Staphylococcus debuckii]|uniref:DUF4870 domain-containing protein n=1 Tax=Staphylococcus debuckii TaxID=2044912 RepID=UPI000F435C30|nr:DUF4870 domain-containing protein [Staphylococcus debuckii]AYU55921.1 DUF4870 domain-containing protein [Staphylococcus debuckii]
MTTNPEFEPVYDEVEKYEQFPTQDERLFASLIYILSFFTSIIGPLIIWLLKGSESEFVNRAGKNYFYSAISYAIWTVISIVLMIVLVGFITMAVIAIMSFVFTIIAAVKAYNGEDYLIPLSIPFFK